jgi:hypothetical protein
VRPAAATTMHAQSDSARSRIRRTAILSLIVAIHAALLLLASRSVTRVGLHGEESLVFLALPDSVPAPLQKESASALPRNTVAPRDTQLVTVPSAPPAQKLTQGNPPTPIDWHAESELAIKQHAELAMANQPRALDKHGAGADLNGGLGPEQKQKPEFAWDRSHTQRVESLETGGILIHINDRCALVLLFPMSFASCSIGKIPVRGDLFDSMHDAALADSNSKNIAP